MNQFTPTEYRILEKMRNGDLEYQAFEAIPSSNNRIKVPNFHYLVYCREDGIWVGYCIDFDLTAYSKERDSEKAGQKLFKRLSQMVILYIGTLIQNDSLDELYSESNWGQSEPSWSSVYISKYNERKVEVLKDSIKKFMLEISEPDSDLDLEDESLDDLYNELKSHQEEIARIKEKIASLLKEKNSNIISFQPRPRPDRYFKSA